MNNNLKSLLTDYQSAIDDWFSERTPEKIKEFVNNVLASEQKSLVMSLIGFKFSFGRWEMINEHEKEANWAYNTYREYHKEAIEELFKSIPPPTLSKTDKQHILKNIKKHIIYNLKEKMIKDATNELTAEIAELLNKAKVTEIKEYEAMLKLIHQQP